MGRRRRLIFGLVLLTTLLGVPAAAGAEITKTAVCHLDSDDPAAPSWHLLAVPDRAVEKHLSHGDGYPGGDVPGTVGFIFDEGCVPAVWTFAQAWSVDSTGHEVLIAQLEDANGDGVPSPGDVVRSGRYPRDFAGGDYGEFTATTHTVTTVVFWIPGDGIVVDTFPEGSFGWSLAGSWEFYGEGPLYFEGGPGGGGWWTSWMVDNLGAESPNAEWVIISGSSPSSPADARIFLWRTADYADDPFLEVELALP